ncbi:DUF2312 domain-containing protein [bacterium]|nr:DUF2312 domain-containing protein [bacterium]
MTVENAVEERLVQYVDDIENLELEKSEIALRIKEVYDQAKIDGFDTKILRQIIRLRKMDPSERDEQQSLLHTYMQVLGMYSSSK